MNDEAARRILKTRGLLSPAETSAGTGARVMVQLRRAEALELLGSVGFGRIVFTREALPAIRPVNHALVDGRLVIRTHEGAGLVGAAGAGVVVAYEADAIDPVARLGWSVVVTGFARLMHDPDTLARYEALLSPWVSGRMDHAVTVSLERVDGFRLTDAGDPRTPAGRRPA